MTWSWRRRRNNETTAEPQVDPQAKEALEQAKCDLAAVRADRAANQSCIDRLRRMNEENNFGAWAFHGLAHPDRK